MAHFKEALLLLGCVEISPHDKQSTHHCAAPGNFQYLPSPAPSAAIKLSCIQNLLNARGSGHVPTRSTLRSQEGATTRSFQCSLKFSGCP